MYIYFTKPNMARKLLLGELKNLAFKRKLSCSAVLRNNDFNYVISSTSADIEIPKMRLMDRISREWADYKNLIAVESAETKKTYTYQQLQNNISTFATSLLKKIGLKPGDVVAVILPNCPEYPVVAIGTMHAGCVLASIDPTHKEFAISYHLNMAEPKLIVTAPECYDTVVKGMKISKNNSKIIVIDQPTVAVPDGAIRFSEIAESGEIDHYLLDKIEKKEDDIAFIPFSSGTTGPPKGVNITYKNLLAGVTTMHSDESRFARPSDGRYQDIIPLFLPFSHVYGLIAGLMGHLPLGCKLITMTKFSANQYFDILKTQEASLLFLVPPVAILLGKHPSVTQEYFRKVRHIICGRSPISALDVQTLLEKCRHDAEFNQGYGATEMASLGTVTFKNTKNIDYSACGVPMANVKLKFANPDTGEPVPIGEQGEIYIKSPTVMKGYHKNPIATRKSIIEDGYYKTGDLGYFKPGVGLFITGRIKEIIKVKDGQVVPAELESLLRSHPAVQDAIVVGVPHELDAESLKAYIVRKNGETITEKEIQDYIANEVDFFKRIDEIKFVDVIPKVMKGTIMQKELDKRYDV